MQYLKENPKLLIEMIPVDDQKNIKPSKQIDKSFSREKIIMNRVKTSFILADNERGIKIKPKRNIIKLKK